MLWAKTLPLTLGSLLLSCGQHLPPEEGNTPLPEICARETSSRQLRINEVMAKNEGSVIDDAAETEDWLELYNGGDEAVELSCVKISGGEGVGAVLPPFRLPPAATHVLWADAEHAQGERHLPFKLKSEGGTLELIARSGGGSIDRVVYKPLQVDEAWARFPDGHGFELCRYASPGRLNGEQCTPPKPVELPEEVFEEFEIPEDKFAPVAPLIVSELDLRPGGFVELFNQSEDPIDATELLLQLDTHGPGLAWPLPGAGVAVGVTSVIAAGQRVAVPLTEEHVAAVLNHPAQEGVVTLFRGDAVWDRVDFMRWPVGAVLTRRSNGLFRYCTNASPGEKNNCEPLMQRDVGDRVRHLHTPGDFAALSQGSSEVGIQSVKVVVDRAPGVVHLLSGTRWALHYEFIREEILKQEKLDRCDQAQASSFNTGWWNFSQKEYFQVEGREFLMSTLSRHAGAGLYAIEYTFGDLISAEQMAEGYWLTVGHTDDPSRWVLRAQDASQVKRARELEGELPIVGPNAPFENVVFQALTEGEAYGTLRFIPVGELQSQPLGPKVVVVTDYVPNDIPFVGGLITEAFQTPLAHVNVLSQSRGTPNAALKAARSDKRFAALQDKLVHLQVTSGGLSIEAADPSEAQAFWKRFQTAGPKVSPRVDTRVRGPQDLADHSLESIPIVGAKASQMAELLKLAKVADDCDGIRFPKVAEQPFAVPLVHYLEHFRSSGAEALLDKAEASKAFREDPLARAAALEEVQALMRAHPVDPKLLRAVEAAVEERFGTIRVRFRSSSNTEDLPNFSGAGLYTSVGAELGDDKRRVEDALRIVWASLWNPRAYDEREFVNIEHRKAAMGVLVHPAFESEEANGVGVSRNLLDPVRGDLHYINAQRGEASVTNPAPGTTTEQLTTPYGPAYRGVEYQSRSSLLLPGETQVLRPSEIRQLSCGLRRIHEWFKPLIDPDDKNPWFAMEIEFKLSDETREVVIKQARPHSFGERSGFGDCREF
jgi:hypothetical protein